MRIAYVYDAVHPWVTGGVQKRVWELGTRLAADHDVHWYGFKWWDGPSEIERDGVSLHGVAEPPDDLYPNGRRSITQALSFAANVTWPLVTADFDLLDCQAFPYFSSFPGRLAAATSPAELVVTWHEVWDDYWYEYLGRKGAFGKAVERIVTRLPDRHLVVSERTRRELVSIGGQAPILVPNGISPDEIARVDPASESPDVVFAGRLIPEKNVGMLVRAVARLSEERPDFRCVVVGDGPERNSLEQFVAERSLEEQIEFRGFVERHDEVLGLLKAAEVFAFPSRREGFGITALEALACGTPVVTIDHPKNAARDLIVDGTTGVVCDPTPEALGLGIEAARQLSPEACIESAAEYDWDDIARRVEDAYREVVECG